MAVEGSWSRKIRAGEEKVAKQVVGWKAWSRENFCNKIPGLLTRAVSF